MTQYAIRRSDGKYLAGAKSGGYRWTEDKSEAALSTEADAQQIIVLLRQTERLPMEPVPADEENGAAGE